MRVWVAFLSVLLLWGEAVAGHQACLVHNRDISEIQFRLSSLAMEEKRRSEAMGPYAKMGLAQLQYEQDKKTAELSLLYGIRDLKGRIAVNTAALLNPSQSVIEESHKSATQLVEQLELVNDLEQVILALSGDEVPAELRVSSWDDLLRKEPRQAFRAYLSFCQQKSAAPECERGLQYTDMQATFRALKTSEQKTFGPLYALMKLDSDPALFNRLKKFIQKDLPPQEQRELILTKAQALQKTFSDLKGVYPCLADTSCSPQQIISIQRALDASREEFQKNITTTFVQEQDAARRLLLAQFKEQGEELIEGSSPSVVESYYNLDAIGASMLVTQDLYMQALRSQRVIIQNCRTVKWQAVSWGEDAVPICPEEPEKMKQPATQAALDALEADLTRLNEERKKFRLGEWVTDVKSKRQGKIDATTQKEDVLYSMTRTLFDLDKAGLLRESRATGGPSCPFLRPLLEEERPSAQTLETGLASCLERIPDQYLDQNIERVKAEREQIRDAIRATQNHPLWSSYQVCLRVLNQASNYYECESLGHSEAVEVGSCQLRGEMAREHLGAFAIKLGNLTHDVQGLLARIPDAPPITREDELMEELSEHCDFIDEDFMKRYGIKKEDAERLKPARASLALAKSRQEWREKSFSQAFAYPDPTRPLYGVPIEKKSIAEYLAAPLTQAVLSSGMGYLQGQQYVRAVNVGIDRTLEWQQQRSRLQNFKERAWQWYEDEVGPLPPDYFAQMDNPFFLPAGLPQSFLSEAPFSFANYWSI